MVRSLALQRMTDHANLLVCRFTEEPTEEETAEMDRIADAAKGKTKAEADDELKEQAEALDWDLSSRDGLRKAAKDMLELLEKGSKDGKTIDLPKENAMQSIGKVCM